MILYFLKKCIKKINKNMKKKFIISYFSNFIKQRLYIKNIKKHHHLDNINHYLRFSIFKLN